jgi:RimJ/RimL family protein N-acetyltransferase
MADDAERQSEVWPSQPAAGNAGSLPVTNITGPTVCLGPAAREHIPLFARWTNDFAVSVLAGDDLRPRSLEAVEADYERASKSDDQRGAWFVIYERATMRPIGEVGLLHISATHRSAELGIYIGEKDCWGKGYGTEAVRLVLDYGFTVLGLHNVMLSTYSYNERAIRAYKRAGFREFGRRRESARLRNRFYDDVYMDCLATEFTSPLPPVMSDPEEAQTS